MEEKRKCERKKIMIATMVRKRIPVEGYEIMEFKSKNLSIGGIFISTEDLTLFDLGEEIEILVDDNGKRYFQGKAVVVRSARIVTEEGKQVESGFGLMFSSPDKEFKEMMKERLISL